MNFYRLLTRIACFLLVLLGAATAFAEDAPISAKAKQHFEAGVSFADDPDGPKWEEAYREFQAAYADSPSYQFMNNLGLSALNLERDSEAIAAYEGFLAQATERDIPAKKRKRVEKDIQMLKMGLVRIAITTSPQNVTLVDERVPTKGNPIINRYQVIQGRHSLGIHPGHHKLTATADGYKPATWEFDAPNGSTFDRAFHLEPVESTANAAQGLPNAGTPTASIETSKGVSNTDLSAPTPNKKKSRTLLYVGAGATAVFAIAATVFGLEAVAKNNELKDKNDGKHIAEAEELRKDTKLFALLSDIGTGAAVVSAVGTAYWYFSGSSNSVVARSANAAAPKATLQAATLRFAPAVSPSSASMNIVGEF